MLKVLIFAVRFAKKRRLIFLLYLLSLSQESLRNDIKRKTKKNFRKYLVVKIKPLTFAPAFKTKVTSSLKY